MGQQNPSFNKNHFYAHINAAVAIIQLYDGKIPFSYFIKHYFAQNKKFGSKDRKEISSMCYACFRLGKSYPKLSIEEKIIKGILLSKPFLLEENDPLLSKYNLPQYQPDNIFSFAKYISPGIDGNAFEKSHLVQPNFFLRIRPGYEKTVIDKLKTLNIEFEIEDDCVSLKNTFKADQQFQLNTEVVVQDKSSQQVAEVLHFYKSQISNKQSTINVWDCCAASGGKSILANDILKNIELTVSDVRPSIIENLIKRFAGAGIKNYKTFVADATTSNPNRQFDLVIADVPCSGSGTWGRSPEQLIYFDEEKIFGYAKLQSQIVSNVINYIKPGGKMLYITCSVFKMENEDRIELLQKKGMQIIKKETIKGYNYKADTMFAALLSKI